jgi:hypothetical protein
MKIALVANNSPKLSVNGYDVVERIVVWLYEVLCDKEA